MEDKAYLPICNEIGLDMRNTEYNPIAKVERPRISNAYISVSKNERIRNTKDQQEQKIGCQKGCYIMMYQPFLVVLLN